MIKRIIKSNTNLNLEERCYEKGISCDLLCGRQWNDWFLCQSVEYSTVGLFGISGLLLVPIVNYAIKLANRYPKIFEWIFIIVCAFGVLFIEDRNTSFVILCLVVAITSNKLSTDSR